MLRQLPRLPPPQLDFLAFSGGLDQVTPPLSTKPGSLKAAENIEIGSNGGYDVVTGYERYDGQASPSDANYYVINVTVTGEFSVGDTITGADSAATAVVIAVLSDHLVITKVVGTFTSTEDLEVSAVVEGTATSVAVLSGASTPKLHAQYKNLAADEYRDDIAAVPGSGNILGLMRLSGVTYAVRNNAGGTAAAIYKSSSSGWTAVALGRELSFTSGGTTEIEEGQTITGALSSATALLTRVVLESGSWAGGDAAGRFIFASQTGTFQAENIDVGASTNLATIAGDSSAITLSPGGKYETVNHNFGGEAGVERIYGCDGVNRGFEFDGTVFAPIDTGMTTDTPTHVAIHKQHLFFSFAGSAQHSGIATPYIWSPVFGASELAVGDTITGFLSEPGAEGDAALVIYSRNSSHVLYGNSSSDWALIKYRKEVGAIEWSMQQLGMTLFLDDRGITNLQTTQAYGNFKHSILSRQVQPFIAARKNNVTASCIVRDKNQFRLFFDDNYALYGTVEGNKILGYTTALLSHAIECAISVEDSDGTEVILFGSDDGFVYQMEKGTSFDGDAINWILQTHFHNSKSPRIKKGYKGCVLEVSGDGYAEAMFTYEIGYNSPQVAQPVTAVTNELPLGESRWDSFTWDAFFWDSVELSITEFKLGGSAENISLVLRGGSDYFSPIKFSGAILRFLYRRQLR